MRAGDTASACGRGSDCGCSERGGSGCENPDRGSACVLGRAAAGLHTSTQCPDATSGDDPIAGRSAATDGGGSGRAALSGRGAKTATSGVCCAACKIAACGVRKFAGRTWAVAVSTTKGGLGKSSAGLPAAQPSGDAVRDAGDLRSNRTTAPPVAGRQRRQRWRIVGLNPARPSSSSASGFESGGFFGGPAATRGRGCERQPDRAPERPGAGGARRRQGPAANTGSELLADIAGESAGSGSSLDGDGAQGPGGVPCGAAGSTRPEVCRAGGI
jgi:hypothetical protein